MQRSRIIGTAAVAALFLAACGHDNNNNDNCCFSPIPPNYGPVSLISQSDAERELGNIATTMSLVDISSGTPSGFSAGATPAARALGPAHAAVRTFGGSQPRAAASPRAAVSTCASGSDQVNSGSKSRTFNYFPFTGTVDYTVDNYNGCANTDSSGTTITYDGLLETGLDTSSVYSYAVLGQPSVNNTVTIFSDGKDANGTPLHIEEDLLGIIEQQNSNSILDNRSNLFATLFASQPNQPDYDGSFQIGNDNSVYEVMIGSNSLNVAGQYAYASTACEGGLVTVTTPTTITLGTSSAGSGLPVGGTLAIGSGSNSESYTFNSDGSATLSGSVSGTLSPSQVQSILLNGTTC